MPVTKGVPIEELIRALHDSNAKRRNLAVLHLRADTSGKDSDPVRVAACYIADEKQWKVFDHEWQKALNAAKVAEFHATDFFNFKREFKGWDEDRAKHIKFAKRFTAIAETRTRVGFAQGVAVEPFNRLLAPVIEGMKSTPHRRFTPLMICSMKLLNMVGHRWKPTAGPIAVLFEDEEGIGEAIDYFNYTKRRYKPRWTEPFITVGTGPKKILGLQAADLLAHESWRRIKEYLQPTGRQIRKSFTRLLRNSKLDIGVIGENELQSMLPAARQYMAEGTLV